MIERKDRNEMLLEMQQSSVETLLKIDELIKMLIDCELHTPNNVIIPPEEIKTLAEIMSARAQYYHSIPITDCFDETKRKSSLTIPSTAKSRGDYPDGTTLGR